MQSAKKILILGLIAGFVFVSVPNLSADETSEAILKILIKKGIISQEEVDQMKAEIAKEKPKPPEALEQRVARLEKEVIKTPKIAHFLNGDMKIGGYVQTRYTVGPSKKVNDSLAINNAKLEVVGHAVPEVAYKVEIGPHKSTGSILYDAFVRAEYFPKARITIGQFKVPFSEEYITSSSAIKTANRALFQGNLSQEYSQGLMLDGNILNNLYYAVAGVTGTKRNVADDNQAKDVIARLVYSPFKNSDNELLQGLKIGTAVQAGRQPRTGTNEGDRIRNLGLLKYTYKGLTFQSEYVHQKFEQTPGLDDAKAEGWYALVAYKFPFKFFDLKTELEPVVKAESYDPNKDLGKNIQDKYTLGLTWYLNKYFYIMGNYEWREEQDDTSNDQFILQSQIKF
jgi:phosphate-selective porin